MSEITKLTLVELTKKIKSKELSALETANAYVSRVKKSKKLNTFITETLDQALVSAKNIDDNNLRPANVYELILWRQRNIQTMKKNVWIFAPQQKGKLFDGDIERIPFISNEINIHTLSLGFGDSDFNGKEYILCFNK